MTTTNTQRTFISKRYGSIISTYYAKNGRAINNINFYNKETGEIVAHNRGWLNGSDDYYDRNRLDCFYVYGEVKSYNAGTDVEKKMKLGGNFTVNIGKKSSYDEPQCDLYVEIDNKTVKLVKQFDYQELSINTFNEITAGTYFYKRTEIEVEVGLEQRTSVYFNNMVGERKEDTTKEQAELDKTYETFRELGIYVDKSDVAKILNRFKFVQRDNSLGDEITNRVQAEHSSEEYGKIMKY